MRCREFAHALLLPLLFGCGQPAPPVAKPTEPTDRHTPAVPGAKPAEAKSKAEELCERIVAATEAKDETKQADALFALEKEAPGLFSPVRTLVRGGTANVRQTAFDDAAKLGSAARPLLPVLVWELNRQTAALTEQAKTAPVDDFATGGLFEQLLPALVRAAPESADLPAVLTRYTTFKTVSPIPKGQRVKDGPTEVVNEHPRVRAAAVAALGQLATANPSARKAVAAALAPQLSGAHRVAGLSGLSACGEYAADALPAIKKLRLDADGGVRAAADAVDKAIEPLATAAPVLDKIAPARNVSKLIAAAFDADDANVKVLAWERLKESAGEVAAFARHYHGAEAKKGAGDSAYSAGGVVQALDGLKAKPDADADGLVRVVFAYARETPKWAGWDEKQMVRTAAVRALARLVPDDKEARKEVRDQAARVLTKATSSFPPADANPLDDADLKPVLIADPLYFDLLKQHTDAGVAAVAVGRLADANPKLAPDAAVWLCKRWLANGPDAPRGAGEQFAKAIALCGEDGQKELAVYRKAADAEEEARASLKTLEANLRRARYERPTNDEREGFKKFHTETMEKYKVKTPLELVNQLKFKDAQLATLGAMYPGGKEQFRYTAITDYFYKSGK